MFLEKVFYKLLLYAVIGFLISYFFKGEGRLEVGIYVFSLLVIAFLPQSIEKMYVSSKTKHRLIIAVAALTFALSYFTLGANRPFLTIVILGISNLMFLKLKKRNKDDLSKTI